MQKFIINQDLLAALDDYDRKSILMERHSNVGLPYEGDLYKDVDDDLIYHVPIYDTCQRRFAAFCSFTEAIWYKDAGHIRDETVRAHKTKTLHVRLAIYKLKTWKTKLHCKN